MSWDQMTNANTSQLLLVELSSPSSIVADERIFVALVDFLDQTGPQLLLIPTSRQRATLQITPLTKIMRVNSINRALLTSINTPSYFLRNGSLVSCIFVWSKHFYNRKEEHRDTLSYCWEEIGEGGKLGTVLQSKSNCSPLGRMQILEEQWSMSLLPQFPRLGLKIRWI